MLFVGLFSAGFLTLSSKFSTSFVLSVFLGIVAVIAGAVYGYKFYLNKKTAELLQQKQDTSTQSALVRKYKQVGIFQHTGTVYTGGMATALLVVFLELTWTTSETEEIEEKVEDELPRIELD